ncbi:FAD binding domain-containing protein [Ornithinimicrobium humiphilum]|uniref:Xanthine dehydrogenase small subunit n=1 Tax=Ornithinimicrobium humiphilum TaxID=125288 RepID=A0A543K726_9MICO|nr:FAD binding domain-containing protein [Ornithinimicrobium humiphilum]TQM90833.1 xanthine dehydrogenase small subunit [Ornithinimicrobium humiphilum]
MTTTSVPAGSGGGNDTGTAAPPGVTVNGAVLPLQGVTPHTTTLDWLRGRGLTGAKEGCAEGECGACAVLVACPATRPDGPPTEWVAVNACLVPAAALDGQEVLTAEGLGRPGALHPVQHEMAVRGGSQCGYCTPGFVCSMAAEFYRPGRTATTADDGRHDAAPDPEHGPNGFDLHALSGNLCRCTGYRPIRDAAYALGDPDETDPLAARRADPPPAPRHTVLEADGARFVRPRSLGEATALLAEHPDAVVVAGATDVGVEVNLRGARPPLVVAVDRLEELRTLGQTDDEIRIGAGLTLTEVERALDGRVPLLQELFPQFASRLIRNGATLGGNLGTASPIGDAAPVLLALDASLVLAGPEGARSVPLADYFTGYRTTVRARDELITEVVVPLPLAGTTAFTKIAKRRFDDISSVAVAVALDVVDGTVARARIGLGGVAATPLRARRTEEALTGAPWDGAPVAHAAEVLGSEGTPMSDHRASDRYRRAMLEQSLLRLHARSAGAA